MLPGDAIALEGCLPLREGVATASWLPVLPTLPILPMLPEGEGVGESGEGVPVILKQLIN